MKIIKFRKSDIKIKHENCRYEYYGWNFSASCFNVAVEKARQYHNDNPNKFILLSLEELENKCTAYDSKYGKYPESDYEGAAVLDYIKGTLK